MYNVLHIMGCSDVGGISTVVLNNYRNIDRSKIHFDIALKTESIGRNAQALVSLGAKVYFLPLKSKGIHQFEIALQKILEENKYDAIHDHEGDTAFIALRIAKKCGLAQRIVHAHSANKDISIKGMMRRKLGQILNSYYATNFIGCGQLAALLTFGKSKSVLNRTNIIYNSVDLQKFKYNKIIREKTRRQLGIESRYVIGMIGRLSLEKNHLFALNIMEKIHLQLPSALLLVVGDGEEKNRINTVIHNKKMGSYVTLLGNREDIAEINQALDINILPSFREGLPVSAVESMAAGIPILLSDKITRELSFGQDVVYLSLDDEKKWIESIISYNHDTNREFRDSLLTQHGFDIDSTASQLQNLYLNFHKAGNKQ